MFQSRIQGRLGLRYPVIQAPMAGGPTTPELVAAVSGAGGLGSLGAAYLAPDALTDAVEKIRALTDRPFAVNLFIPTETRVDRVAVARMRDWLAGPAGEMGIAAPDLPESLAPDFEAQAAALAEARVPVVSFTFGMLSARWIERLRSDGAMVIGTATTVAEARALEQAGVDAVIAQGGEAGGHRGTFLAPFENALIGGLALIPAVVDALTCPVIASGGIMDGRGIVAARALGAEAVQMGTAFLTTTESGAHAQHKDGILAADETGSRVTRAFSGRPARAIGNRFMDELEQNGPEIPEYPVQNALTRGLRKAAAEQDRAEFLSLWAGQGVRLARRGSAAELVARLAEEMAHTLTRLTDAGR